MNKFLNELRDDIQKGTTGIDGIDIKDLNTNFEKLVECLGKIDTQHKSSCEEINKRLQALEKKQALSTEEYSILISTKSMIHEFISKFSAEQSERKQLVMKISEQQNSLMKNISSQLHGQGILFFIWAWVLFFTIASVAQEIFHISGFSGIWSWIKVTTGLKVLMGMFL